MTRGPAACFPEPHRPNPERFQRIAPSCAAAEAASHSSGTAVIDRPTSAARDSASADYCAARVPTAARSIRNRRLSLTGSPVRRSVMICRIRNWEFDDGNSGSGSDYRLILYARASVRHIVAAISGVEARRPAWRRSSTTAEGGMASHCPDACLTRPSWSLSLFHALVELAPLSGPARAAYPTLPCGDVAFVSLARGKELEQLLAAASVTTRPLGRVVVSAPIYGCGGGKTAVTVAAARIQAGLPAEFPDLGPALPGPSHQHTRWVERPVYIRGSAVGDPSLHYDTGVAGTAIIRSRQSIAGAGGGVPPGRQEDLILCSDGRIPQPLASSWRPLLRGFVVWLPGGLVLNSRMLLRRHGLAAGTDIASHSLSIAIQSGAPANARRLSPACSGPRLSGPLTRGGDERMVGAWAGSAPLASGCCRGAPAEATPIWSAALLGESCFCRTRRIRLPEILRRERLAHSILSPSTSSIWSS